MTSKQRTSTDWKETLRVGVPLIEEQYEIIGGPMTVRRIFYLFVSAGLIKNNNSQYVTLSKTLARAREQGRLLWKYITDGSRSLIDLEVYNPEDLQIPKPEWYMSDPSDEQEEYVEVWVEKAGNIPILAPICRKWFVRLVSTGGRTSVTYKHDGAQRFLNTPDEQRGTILYISDLDADGQHFPVETEEYFATKEGAYVDVEKTVLTHEQVREHDLPVLEKIYSADYMKRKFVQEFVDERGHTQVEIDALPVAAIRQILEEALSSRLSLDVIRRVKKASVLRAEERLREEITKYNEEANQ